MISEIITIMEKNNYFLLEYKDRFTSKHFEFGWNDNYHIRVMVDKCYGDYKSDTTFYINTDIAIPDNEDKLDLLYDEDTLELLYAEVDDIKRFKKTEYPKLQELMKGLGIKECKN